MRDATRTWFPAGHQADAVPAAVRTVRTGPRAPSADALWSDNQSRGKALHAPGKRNSALDGEFLGLPEVAL